MVSRYVEIMAELPKTPSDKVRKAVLRVTGNKAGHLASVSCRD
ncbi:hypothetical protein ACFL9U_08195 [Thermodesulfobacteriota bacterium]